MIPDAIYMQEHERKAVKVTNLAKQFEGNNEIN